MAKAKEDVTCPRCAKVGARRSWRIATNEGRVYRCSACAEIFVALAEMAKTSDVDKCIPCGSKCLRCDGTGKETEQLWLVSKGAEVVDDLIIGEHPVVERVKRAKGDCPACHGTGRWVPPCCELSSREINAVRAWKRREDKCWAQVAEPEPLDEMFEKQVAKIAAMDVPEFIQMYADSLVARLQALIDAGHVATAAEAGQDFILELSRQTIRRLAVTEPAPPTWIAVEDGLPEPGVDVCFRGDGVSRLRAGWYSARCDYWREYGHSTPVSWKVTHWQPLPAPPSDEETGE